MDKLFQAWIDGTLLDKFRVKIKDEGYTLKGAVTRMIKRYLKEGM